MTTTSTSPTSSSRPGLYHQRGSLGPVDWAFTDRDAGDLAIDRVDPWPEVLADFAPGDRLVDLHQVHGAAVVAVTGTGGPGDGRGASAPERPEADGAVTGTPGLVLAVRAADCVPVLLADPEARLIGAVHAGRGGVVAGVVPAAVGRLRDLGARHLVAWIGPHVCGACYEVPVAMREAVAALVPSTHATTSRGTPGLDLGAGVRAQLEMGGVRVIDVAACTMETPTLWSHRRDGRAAGRQAALIRLRSRDPVVNPS